MADIADDACLQYFVYTFICNTFALFQSKIFNCQYYTMTAMLLNAYDTGNAIGETATYVILALMAIVWIWVMFKYLNTSDLND